MSAPAAEEQTDTARLEAFSDGVFAIAITLLVLELTVPDGGGSLWHKLIHEWPQFAAYLSSFAVIGVMWVNHHSMFRAIVRTDRPLLFLNLLLLLWTSLLPFPTSLVSRYLGGGGWDASTAEAVYSANLTLAAIAFSLVWLRAVRGGRLIASPLGAAAERSSLWRFSVGTFGYAATIGLAFVSAPLALGIQVALALYYAFEQVSA